MPKRFRQWHADQVDAIETEIARNDVAMNDAWEQLARDNAAFRAQECMVPGSFLRPLECTVDIRAGMKAATSVMCEAKR